MIVVLLIYFEFEPIIEFSIICSKFEYSDFDELF